MREISIFETVEACNTRNEMKKNLLAKIDDLSRVDAVKIAAHWPTTIDKNGIKHCETGQSSILVQFRSATAD